MGLMLSLPGVDAELKPRITVIGVGGAGCNAVNNMIRSSLEGVEFVVANTDAQALRLSQCERRIQLGMNVTNGLGSGARPDVGRASAEECLDVIQDHLQGSNMAFITAGMGGGTGTGAAPVVARVARELGILTVGVVTKPFHFEGHHRMALAEEGLRELQEFVDTLLVIPNQNLFRVANEKTTFADAFKMADNVLHAGVRGVTDLMINPGLINLDFADIRTVMAEMGKAMMGTGEASGERRAIEAAEAAIANPLLEDVSMKGAKGLLINITGGLDMTLFEVDEAANRVREEVDENANIIFGSTFDQNLEGIIRVSIVATGIDSALRTAAPRSSTSSKPTGSATPPSGHRNTEPQPEPDEAEDIPEAAILKATGTDGLAPAMPPLPLKKQATGRASSENHPLAPRQSPAVTNAQQQVPARETPAILKPFELRFGETRPVPSGTSEPAERTRAEQPRTEQPRAEQQKAEPRTKFGLFQRVTNPFALRNQNQPLPQKAAPVIRSETPGTDATTPGEENADGGIGTDLNIPSFLRRQAN